MNILQVESLYRHLDDLTKHRDYLRGRLADIGLVWTGISSSLIPDHMHSQAHELTLHIDEQNQQIHELDALIRPYCPELLRRYGEEFHDAYRAFCNGAIDYSTQVKDVPKELIHGGEYRHYVPYAGWLPAKDATPGTPVTDARTYIIRFQWFGAKETGVLVRLYFCDELRTIFIADDSGIAPASEREE